MLAAAGLKDHQAHPIAICEDGGVPEAQHPEAPPLNIGCPPLVISDLVRMLSAIDLHDEARFGAVKIHDVGAARDLALPSPAPEAAITKGSPEACLRVRVLTPQTTGAIPLGRVFDGPNLGHGGMVDYGWTTLQVVVRSRPSPYPLPSRFASGKRSGLS
jgi:hypothetical protein